MNLSDYATRQNETTKRFELDIDGQLSVIEYTLKKSTNQIFLVHTEVARQIQGSGIGNKIVKESLDIVRQKGYQLVPLCPFVVAYLKRHPEYHDLIDPSKQPLFKR